MAEHNHEKYGEWIPDDYGFYHCSECGYEHDEPEYVTPFCPNCGAHMEQPEEMEEEMQPNTEYKHDTDKTRLDLVESSLIEAVGRIRTYGVQKYHSPDNWRKVEKYRYVAAAMRHFEAYRSGEKNDPESGMPHLWHVACNIMFLIELERCDNADIK
ncbi:MAG: dATP/dGTP diphosphohydrolase domain-containing protein [Ruminiclostridium sp.]